MADRIQHNGPSAAHPGEQARRARQRSRAGLQHAQGQPKDPRQAPGQRPGEAAGTSQRPTEPTQIGHLPGTAEALFKPMQLALRTAAALTETTMSAMQAVMGASQAAMQAGLASLRAFEPAGAAFDEGYWREHFSKLPYVDAELLFSQYRPAFRFGWQQALQHAGKSFEEVQEQLERNWERARSLSQLSWEQAQAAVRDAFQHARARP